LARGQIGFYSEHLLEQPGLLAEFNLFLDEPWGFKKIPAGSLLMGWF